MIRYIPGKTRVKTEFMRNITFGDLILAFICVVFAIVIIASNLFTIGGVSYKWYALLGWAAFSIVLFMPIDEGLRLYGSVILILRFMAFPRKYIQGGKGNKSMQRMTPFFNIETGKFINFGTYSGMVLEIDALSLDLMQEDAQDQLILSFSKALKLISQYQRAMLIKTVKPMRFDVFLKNDDRKFELISSYMESLNGKGANSKGMGVWNISIS